mgnify:CR=1 FL=1
MSKRDEVVMGGSHYMKEEEKMKNQKQKKNVTPLMKKYL